MKRTLEAIRAVCEVSDDGCWLWPGALIDGKYPQATFDGQPGQLVRRVAFVLAGGKLRGRRYVLVSTCDRTTCCNPAHVQQMSRSRKIRDEYTAGTRRRRCAPPSPARKLTPEQALEVRDGGGNRVVVAERFGITPTHVDRIRRGVCWAPRRASVFHHGFGGKVSAKVLGGGT